MARKYTNPPLVEAIFELHFAPSSAWDWSVSDKFKSGLGDAFPEAARVMQTSFEVQPESATMLQHTKEVKAIRFMNSQSGRIVQIGPDGLIVVQKKPYEKWAVFKEFLSGIVEHYLGVAASPVPIRWVLRFVDHVHMPKGEAPLNEWLRVLPLVPPSLAGHGVTAMSTRLQFNIPEAHSQVVYEAGSMREQSDDFILYAVDIGCLTQDHQELPFERLSGWLDHAHDLIERAFDDSFTERAHSELFGEKK